MALFPAFANPQKSNVSSNSQSDKDILTPRPSFPSFSSLAETKSSIEPDHPSFSFNFDAKELHDVKNTNEAQPPPEIIDVFSSEDEEVAITGEIHRGHEHRAERKRKRKAEKKPTPERKAERSVDKKRRTERKAEKKRKHREKDRRSVAASAPPPQQSYSTRNPKIIFLKDAGVTPEQAFCLDPNAEVINLTFDATYWKNVPKYRRPPRWVLGLRKDSARRKQNQFRYFQDSKEMRSLRSSAAIRFVVPDDLVPFGRNYIPLPDDLENQPDDEEAAPASDVFRDRNAAFNEKLRKEPTNVTLWLDFLRFQDDLVRNYYGGGGGTGGLERNDQSKVTRSGLLERKMSILERAIEKNPESVELKFRRLAMCEDTWEKEELNKEWRQFAFSHPNDPHIWREYLFFLQSYFSTFSFSRIQKAFEKHLSIWRSISAGTFQSHAAVSNHDDHFVLFLCLLSDLWMQSGHQEKCVAVQQAWLELNLHFPVRLSEAVPLKDALVFMEAFWDSGISRFGEKNSLGWGNSMAGAPYLPSDVTRPDFSEEEEPLLLSSSSSAELWIKLEKFRQEKFLLPYHGTEELLDPERSVLFDDVQPFLFRFQRNPPNEHLFFMVVNNFLLTLRCPLLMNFSTESYGWRSLVSLFQESPFIYFFANWTESHFCPASSDNYSGTLFLPFQAFYSDQDSLINGIFEQSSAFFSGFYSTYLSVCWMQYKLNRFLTATGDKSAAKKEVRSLAKALLKKTENRNNLLIWEWYAFAEGKLEGNWQATSKILETVLSSTQPAPDDPSGLTALARVVRFYVENLLGICHSKKSASTENEAEEAKQTALNVLLRFFEKRPQVFSKNDACPVEPTTNHRIFKCRIALNQLLQEAEEVDKTDCTRVYAFGSRYCNVALCTSLFEYLTSGLDGSISFLRDTIQRSQISASSGKDFDFFRERSRMDWQILTEATLRLTWHHQKTASFSASAFREVLLNGMRDFPNNSTFLLIFTLTEVSSFISGRLRAYFDTVLDRATTTIPWIFAIYSEYERRYRLWKNLKMACDANLTDGVSLSTFKDTGMSNKLRSLFERAVESSVCRHCPLIWRMYLKFEMDEENLRGAEGIYFRAMQSCPWAKNVYVDAIKYFPHRIQEILDVMLEKELRIVAPFEEVDLLMKSKELAKNST